MNRRCFGIAVLLSCLLGLAQPVAADPQPEPPRVVMAEEDYWRLTADGWEWMRPTPPSPRPLMLHPLTVAAFQCLASIGALMLADRGER